MNSNAAADIEQRNDDSTVQPSFHQRVMTGLSRLDIALRYLAASSWFAYATIILLLAKRVWWMWIYRDLSFSDTAFYFSDAHLWYKQLVTTFYYSPLYTVFYGTLMHFTEDAYAVTILHRLIIAFLAALLFLALLRRLLPHGIAWLVAAWWVVNPITFDAFHEVHFFAVLPMLVGFLVAAWRPNAWTRGAALSIFIIAGVLVRNELIVAAGCWAVICLIYEIRDRRRGLSVHLKFYLRAYGTPLLLAAIIIGMFYAAARVKFPELAEQFRWKHWMNVCNVYAYSYRQQHPEWTKSPWSDCQELMLRDFGLPEPSLIETFRQNPGAMLDFVKWNVQLVPDGLQVLLFNATSGYGQPDYVTVRTGATYAGILSIIVIVTIIVGVILLLRRRHYWWEFWLRDRAAGWLALISTLPIMIFVMLTQRPRPSYVFNLGFFLMAVVGMSVFVIFERWPQTKRWFIVMPLVMIVSILVVPGYYDSAYRNLDGSQSRPLLQRYRRLQPLQSVIAQPQETLLSPGYASELCFYVGLSWCSSDEYHSFMVRPNLNESLADWLDEHHITLVYLDEQVLSRPEIPPFLAEAQARHWSTIAAVQTPSEHWMLLRRDRPLNQDIAALKTLNTIPDITNPDAVAALHIDGLPWDARAFVGSNEGSALPSDGLLLGNGWGIPEDTSIGLLRWVDNDAEIVLTAPTGHQQTMVLDIEAGPSLGNVPLKLEVRRADDSVLQTLDIAGRTEAQVTLPVTSDQGEVFTLHVVNDTDRPASDQDQRVLNFRVFRIGWLTSPEEAVPAE